MSLGQKVPKNFTWHERMTDSRGPQRRTLCFLSTLLSQKVPEKSDTVLRCMIAGQPKPEVTWYKNGQTIEDCSIVSSYEFFESQYIHVLHLYCCSPDDAAVYQIAAKNCSGMICCSASIEVERSSANPQLSPNLKNDRDTGWKHGTETCEQKSTNHTDEKEHSDQEEESPSLGPRTAAGSPSSEGNHLCSLQLLAGNDLRVSSSENPLDVKGTRQTEAAWDPNDPEEAADGLLSPDARSTGNNACGHRTMQSSTDGADDKDLNSGHQHPKAQKYISVSLPLSEAATSAYPGDRAPVNTQVNPQVSSQDSDSDYELCPEITLTYTEEFSDDDLEYLECSDVMTDYSNAVWQRDLQGTECVFLLESDDEVMEFSECCLGESEPFFSEMGSGPRVSDNTGLMEAAAGCCGHHSRPQEVTGRHHGASPHSPSSPQAGMTLTLGTHRDGTSMVTDQGTYKLPVASAENDYPGIQGETRDRHQAGEEFASDDLLSMDKAVTEIKVKCLSGELEKSGVNQCMETPAEKKAEGKDSWNKKGSEKAARVRRPGTKGKPKQLNPNLKDSATEGTLHLLCPKEPVTHTLTQSDQKEGPRAKAGAPDLNAHLCAGEGALPTHTEQEAKTLPAPAGTLPKEGNLNLEGEGVQVKNLCETSWAPDQSDHPQVHIQETVREKASRSPMPAFSEPAGEESAFTGTTTNALSDSGGIHKENVSLAQYLETESCTQGPWPEGNQDREDGAPGHSWEDLGHEFSLPDTGPANTSPCELSVHLPQEGGTDPGEPEAVSAASPAPTNMIPTLETVCPVPRGREAACVMEHLEAGDQGTCGTMESPVGVPVDNYLPQEICSTDLVLAESQSKASDLCSPDGQTRDILLQIQGSEPPQSTPQSNNHEHSVMLLPTNSTVTSNIALKASEDATRENAATVGSSTSTLASSGQASQEGLSPSALRGPLPSEMTSLRQFEKGSNDSPSTSALDVTDTPARPSSTVTFPQEKPATLTANLECLQVALGSGDTPSATIAPKVHPPKYLPVSIAGNSHAGGSEASSPQVSGGNSFQVPFSADVAPISNGSTTDSPQERLCVAPEGLGARDCVPPLAPLHNHNQSGEKSWTMDRTDNRSLAENFPEKGSETTQKVQQQSLPPQGSLAEDNLQGRWSTSPAIPEEVSPGPGDHSLANSEEDRGQRAVLGTNVSVVAKATMGEDSQAVSNDALLSNIPVKTPKESGPGQWEANPKLKVIILEASVSEVWPSRELMGAECKELDAGAAIPDGVWAASEVLKAGAAGPAQDPSEGAASALSPQVESGSALADSRENHKGEEPASHAHLSSDPSQYPSQPKLLESSVDPVDEKELHGTDLPSEASATGGQGNVNSKSQKQEDSQLGVDHAAFFTQFLTRPKVLESSVDPIDETGVAQWWAETQEPSPSRLGGIQQKSTLNDGSLGQRMDVQLAILPVPGPQQSGGTLPSENSINQNQEASKRGQADRSRHTKAEVEIQPAVLQVLSPDKGGEMVPSACNNSQVPESRERGSGEAELSPNHTAESASPVSPLSSCLVTTRASGGADTHTTTGRMHDVPKNDLPEPRSHPCAFSDSDERGDAVSECGRPWHRLGGLTQVPLTSSPDGNITTFSISHRIEKPEMEVLQSGDNKPTSASGSPAVTWAFISEEGASETAPKAQQDPGQPSSTLVHGKKSWEERLSHTTAQPGRPPVTASEWVKKKQGTAGSGYITEGVKKKILSRVAALRLRLEEKENARKNSSFLKKIPKLEASVLHTDEKHDPQKLPCKREGKAPVLLKKIQAEMFPDHSGNVKLSCQFAEIHEDSTIWWTKDAQSIAQVQRSAGDHSKVSLVIVQASQKDLGLYYCCIKNSYGTGTAEFNLTAEVLKQLSSHQDIKGCEEIEFSQLIFKEDFLRDSYFGDHLRGQIATEELHFGEGVHRKAFRSKVMRGLTPVFQPGHACVLKVHNAVAYGTRNNDELVHRNYTLAAQECYVQNTARYYAKIYAAEAQPLEGFGEVPEIIPIFLIHRPENNIPYATVEEELIGEFVKYSIRDGKEINFLRRESEAGQKCCTFQHWVYQKTGGCLLVTDMQGVGMKLTDVGIATLAKGYKGFKGNCSMTFIDQFKALHQCNKYCKMLGLKPLQNNNQKQKKPSTGKNKLQPNSTTVKKTAPGTPAEKKT